MDFDFEKLSRVIALLDSSYSPFHVIHNEEEEFLKAGFLPLSETKKWNLERGKSYYVKRNSSSLIAFKVPADLAEVAFHGVACHSDSPTFKVKPNPVTTSEGLLQLQVEPYGGLILRSWFDRPLSLAGRIMVQNKEGVHSELLAINEDLLEIPSLCIHFDRNVNSQGALDPSRDMIPVLGSADPDFDFLSFLGKKAGLEEGEKVIDYDLYLYLREHARLLGVNHEFLLSPKEDDLSSSYSSFLGFLDGTPSKAISLYCCFDNEEVGSLTRQGAASSFFKDVLNRVCAEFGAGLEQSLASSFLLSIDNAHANHPNHPEISAKGVSVRMNGGIVLKHNASQSYTSDAFSGALVKAIAEKEEIPVQEFTNRSDLRGGSTLGNLLNGVASLPEADIGIAQLAMHSSTELLGALDIERMRKFVASYLSFSFAVNEDSISF